MSACNSGDVVRAPAHTGVAPPTRPEHELTEMGTPFPWLPMVAIASCLVAVAYTLCNLFPYAGYMVRQLGVTDDKDEAGFYAGYLASAFMFGRFGGSYFWGRFADTYGRLPVMYIGLWSTTVLSVTFGMSTTFAWAVASRFLLGALNGLLPTAKTMIYEVCGREHEVIGMSFVIGCRSVGLVIGSGLGGLLAEPATHYPTTFSESGLFGRFPYLLPNILGAGLALIALPMVFFFLDETLDVHRSGDRPGFEPISTPEAELDNQAEAADAREGVRASSLDNGYDPQITSGRGARTTAGSGGNPVCLTVGNNGGSNIGSAQARVEERLPLVEKRLGSPSRGLELEGGELRSVHNGARVNARSCDGGIEKGEGVDAGGSENRGGWRRIAFMQECLLPMKLLEEKRVRAVLFVYVLFSFLALGFDEAYPLWAISSVSSGGMDWTTHDVGQALAACGGAMLIFQFLVYPWVVKRVGLTRSQRWSSFISIPVFLAYPLLRRLRDSKGVLMAASLILLLFTNMAISTMFTNLSLAINNAVNPSQRGTLNGLSLTFGSLATAAGPTVCSTIFAWSVNHRRPFPLDCHLIFCIFALGMIVVTATSWNIVIKVKSKPEGCASSSVLVAEKATRGVEEVGLSSGK